MPIGLKLPKSEEDLVATMNRLVGESAPMRNREKLRWLLIMLYMQGVRQFDAIDWNTGSVTVAYPGGTMRDQDFRIDKVLDIYQVEAGRLLQADLSPVVSRKSQGLDDLRKASTGQVVLDHVISKQQANALKLSAIGPFLRGGHIGMGAFAEDNAKVHIDLIPGWELSSIPADPVIDSNIEGLMRCRWVSYTWLKENGYVGNLDAITKGKLILQERPIGNVPQGDSGISEAGKNLPYAGSAGKKDKKDTADWGYLVEAWTRDSDDYLLQYAATMGQKKLMYNDTSEARVPMPIQSARYVDTGGFYGRGVVEQFIPLNNELEYMLQQLFDNVEDFDLMGYLCVPSGMGLTLEEVQKSRKGPKTFIYESDPASPQAKIFNLTPANAATLPTSVVEMALSLMKSQSGQSELFSGDAPGRIDNAKALNFLYETANIPLTSPMESLSQAFARIYKAALFLIKTTWSDNQEVALSLDDDVLVGIKYDPIKGNMTLDRSAIPHPDEVTVTVAAKMPQSHAQLKAELQESLAAGIITPREYRIKSRLAGLDLPVANEREWQSYRKAKMENILLFGDGDNPGEIFPSPRDFHEVHMEVLAAFMARPEFSLAKQAVQDAFAEHYKFHMEGQGAFPDQMPYPDEAAEQMQMNMQ